MNLFKDIVYGQDKKLVMWCYVSIHPLSTAYFFAASLNPLNTNSIQKDRVVIATMYTSQVTYPIYPIIHCSRETLRREEQNPSFKYIFLTFSTDTC